MSRWRSAVRALRWVPSVLVLAPLLLGPTQLNDELRLRDLTGSVSFRLLDWETVHLGERAGRLLNALDGAGADEQTDTQTLRAYFDVKGNKQQLRRQAEAAIEDIVAQAYRDAGITRSQPVQIGALFPPVLVALTPPPNVLVVSPRNELRVTSSVVLQSMDVAAQERLEVSADSANVSSLVAPIGGLATYPSMVLEADASNQVLSAVAHEWMHQYLIFYPLGEGYWNSQETREINETTAELVGQEVGGQLAQRLGVTQPAASAPARTANAFDFRAFIRETRLEVERLLLADQVEQAEAYMRSRRDELQQHGYALRKLNQAYFALYGSYGEGAAASPANPIPGLLRQLRERSSLADFVFAVRNVTSVAQLRAVVAMQATQL